MIACPSIVRSAAAVAVACLAAAPAAAGLRVEFVAPERYTSAHLAHSQGAVQRAADMNYLARSAYRRSDSMPLPHERLMPGNWFNETFCR